MTQKMKKVDLLTSSEIDLIIDALILQKEMIITEELSSKIDELITRFERAKGEQ